MFSMWASQTSECLNIYHVFLCFILLSINTFVRSAALQISCKVCQLTTFYPFEEELLQINTHTFFSQILPLWLAKTGQKLVFAIFARILQFSPIFASLPYKNNFDSVITKISANVEISKNEPFCHENANFRLFFQ